MYRLFNPSDDPCAAPLIDGCNESAASFHYVPGPVCSERYRTLATDFASDPDPVSKFNYSSPSPGLTPVALGRNPKPAQLEESKKEQEQQLQQTTEMATASANHMTVTIQKADGSTEIRSGGTASWRNNNPGNLINGAGGYEPIGQNGRFSIFSNYEDGLNALIANLQRPKYKAGTLADAIEIWAPTADHNHPTTYAERVSKSTGIATSTKMNTLTYTQLAAIATAIKQQEGWREGTVTTKPAPTTH